ncbi:MAG TPA: alpha-glucuronidase family glycosyl hydrolase [Bryobacteraceae bacterium]|nr:alpha-glucuronidase family glycosyl hydrolase [Bryobacteraceae bacterium]
MKTLFFLISSALWLQAETGYDAWLRYAPVRLARPLPAAVFAAGDSKTVTAGRDEIVRGVRGMTARTLRIESALPREDAIILGAMDEMRRLFPQAGWTQSLDSDAFWLRTITSGNLKYTVVTGGSDRGVLYGAFALLRKIATGDPVTTLDEKQTPYAPVRWVNQWDNLDGSIERGYGGRSIFWEGGHARQDLSRVSDYGRLLASLGINATTIDNVNADKRLLSDEYIPQVARIAEALRPWGVRIALSVDFGSPQSLGGLNTFDPLDPKVAAWWKQRADAIYAAIPDLAGFVLKADSEGRVGPSAYKRTHADAANVVARALAAHQGVLLYRGFVYDHRMDWNNPKNDRARAAYDNFKPLDGQFDGNVIIQIKNGPIDFQVREPVSPLFEALEKTNEVMELQVTQEYMGQARHMVFLAPQWKEVLDVVRHQNRKMRGFAGVVNVGLDDNWLGNHLSQANLYAYGRLAWNPALTSEAIVREWTVQTFGSDPKVVETVDAMQSSSWKTYENYTGPLGLQTLTDIVGNHYGVAVEASENNGWGQWHRADAKGVGMDRTVATGTGYIGQYNPHIAHTYENLQTCPDELLLFMHHVPYTHVLHSGKTVIQTIYDSHYEGARAAEAYAPQWESLKGKIDDQRYAAILAQLKYQAGQAQVWRDSVVSWFLKESGIPDAKGRAGHYPGRIEAESMTLDGYSPVDVKPWETASGGKAIACDKPKCSASTRFDGAPGWYDLRIQYFDQNNGISHFRTQINHQVVDEWDAADRIPTRKMDGSSSTRREIDGIALRPGDQIVIEGTPNGGEPAGLDYIEILPPPAKTP